MHKHQILPSYSWSVELSGLPVLGFALSSPKSSESYQGLECYLSVGAKRKERRRGVAQYWCPVRVASVLVSWQLSIFLLWLLSYSLFLHQAFLSLGSRFQFPSFLFFLTSPNSYAWGNHTNWGFILAFSPQCTSSSSLFIHLLYSTLIPNSHDTIRACVKLLTPTGPSSSGACLLQRVLTSPTPYAWRCPPGAPGFLLAAAMVEVPSDEAFQDCYWYSK